jgi:hypothetical protein
VRPRALKMGFWEEARRGAGGMERGQALGAAGA